MFSNESNSSKNYTTKIGKKIFFFNSEEQIRAENMGKHGYRRESAGQARETNQQPRSHIFLCYWAIWNGKQDGTQPGKQAGWQTGWVAGRWERLGHPSLPCCVVIRHPLGSSGLFELYVPLIIHLGCSALGQAHKDLIYSLAGNETTWGCCAESRDCRPCCQVIELMDGLQRYSTPSMTPPFSREHPFVALPYLSSSPTLAANKSFYGHSLDASPPICSYTFSYLKL